MSNALPAPCDVLTARNNDATNPPAHPRLVIATTILASSLALIDSSVVNVGLPAISQSFDTDAVGLQWVVNAYLLPLSALLLLGGAVGDRFGRRRLLVAGVILFGIASLACSAAPTLPRDRHLGGNGRRCGRGRPCSRWVADRCRQLAPRIPNKRSGIDSGRRIGLPICRQGRRRNHGSSRLVRRRTGDGRFGLHNVGAH